MNIKALLSTGCIITLISPLMGKDVPLDLPLRVVSAGNTPITTQQKPSPAVAAEKKDKKALERNVSSKKETAANALDQKALKKDDSALSQNTNKTTLTLRQLISTKKGALLDFWAWWCPPCMQSIPHLIETEKELSAKGIAVAGISVDENLGKTQSVQQTHKIQFAWLMDDDKDPIAKTLEIDSIPRWILLDNNGKVLFDGHPTLDKDAYQKALKELESRKP